MPAEDEYYAEYESFTGGENPEAFDAFMTMYAESGAADDLDVFFEFLNTFYPDVEHHDKEWWDQMRESFYDYSGLTDQNIDWELWRSIIEQITPTG